MTTPKKKVRYIVVKRKVTTKKVEKKREIPHREAPLPRDNGVVFKMKFRK